MALKYNALLRTVGEELNAIEEMFLGVFKARVLALATGVHLDRIGSLVGQTREGSPDAMFRRKILARVLVNRSSGRLVDLQRIIACFTDSVPVIQFGGGVALVQIGAISLADAQLIHRFLLPAVTATVRLQVHYLFADPSETFTFAENSCVAIAPIVGGSPMNLEVIGAEYMPDAGTVIVGEGTTGQTTATYISRTATHLIGFNCAASRTAGTAIQIANSTAKGFGSNADPLIGGKLAGLV